MTGKRLRLLRVFLLAAGVLCIGIGIFRGEAEEVMIKAVNLCLECIGIG